MGGADGPARGRPLAGTDPRHAAGMLREMFTAKLHRGAVSDVRIDYEGSLTIDAELIRRSGMLIHQKIQVLNISNGYRLETYVIPGGPGDLIVNGAAARHAVKGDRLIVIAYGLLTDDEIRTHVPKVLVLNEKNQIVDEH
jgi:aspartate 1-decarboxylase